MARQGTKRQHAIEIMSANVDKPMAVVLEMLQKEIPLSNHSEARTYYKYLCENHMAPGVVDSTRKPREPKVEGETTTSSKSASDPTSPTSAAIETKPENVPVPVDPGVTKSNAIEKMKAIAEKKAKKAAERASQMVTKEIIVVEKTEVSEEAEVSEVSDQAA